MIVHPMNSEQLRAATTRAPLCYVKAGPGSGKTYLATEAFGFLRHERYRDDPRGVLGVTFARSARSELAARVGMRWGYRTIGWPSGVCTFDELHRQLLRYLVVHGFIDWPSGRFPTKVDDSWQDHPGSTGSPGKRTRYMLTLNDEGAVVAAKAITERAAPKPCFTDPTHLTTAIAAGFCTHADVRNVLSAAMDPQFKRTFSAAVSSCLGRGYCHLIVDEVFDMNHLDALVVERAIEAGVTVTLVGDPWQSLYEFRGASPDEVHRVLQRKQFQTIEMPGARRYLTDDMRTLARRLFDEQPFAVIAARNGDEFDIVLAHDWNALWDERRIAVLPMGRPSGLDGSELANCFVLLLNEVVRGYFGRDAAGVVEARRKLSVETCEGRIGKALALLRNPAVALDDVWAALQAEFQPPGVRWAIKGKRATSSMERLRELCLRASSPALGLTIHQSKGLEWDNVLLLNGELSTNPTELNCLERRHEDHRSVYVGLTRARMKLRVLHVPGNPFSPRTPIARVKRP